MPLASIVQVPFLALFGVGPWPRPFRLRSSGRRRHRWSGPSPAMPVRPHPWPLGAGILIAIPLLSTVYSSSRTTSRSSSPSSSPRCGWVRGACEITGGVRRLPTPPRARDAVAGTTVCCPRRHWDWCSPGIDGGRAGRRDQPTSDHDRNGGGGCRGLHSRHAPWWFRQLAMFGSLSPSTGSGKVLFIRSTRASGTASRPGDRWSTCWGWGRAADRDPDRWSIAAVTIYRPSSAASSSAPLLIVGGWVRRRSPDFLPFFVYAGCALRLLEPGVGGPCPGGTFIHSAVALAPFSYVLALEGLVSGSAGSRRGDRRGIRSFPTASSAAR